MDASLGPRTQILSLTGVAMPLESSRGRRYVEPRHPFRNDFQRDRDRIVHSRAFRRLENKTQVFTRRFSDHFRNRLTHTIEVSQISRTIARALGLNGDLVEALALAHDVGHPPFGHAGEKALDAAMRAHGFSFDHNLHALRIVEDFETRYADFRGLNLTYEVREGIVKHSRDYSAEQHPELAEYMLDLRPPLEAQLIDLTDEIAYTTADLDDGYEAEILPLAQIRHEVPLFEHFYGEAVSAHPHASEQLMFNDALRRLLNALVTDLIESTAANVERARVGSLEELRRHPDRLAVFGPEIERERRRAKEFLYRELYDSPELRPEKDMAERIVTELFEHWIENPAALPESYRDKGKREPLPRVVCDYIAGMTDHYIREQHRRVFDK
jgi:dGTPase